MTIPLTQIHAVDVLGANYFDLALINVVLVQGLMAVTMAWWAGGSTARAHSAPRRAEHHLLGRLPRPGARAVGGLGLLRRAFRGVAMGGGTLIWMLGSLYYARSRDRAPIYLGIHTVLTGVRWGLAPFAGVALSTCAVNPRAPCSSPASRSSSSPASSSSASRGAARCAGPRGAARARPAPDGRVSAAAATLRCRDG